MFDLRWKKSHHDVSIPSGCCSTHLILCVGPSTYYRGVSNSATQEQKIMDKSNFRNPQLIMHFSEKDNKSWVSDDGIYYCFIKYLEHKKTKSHKNQHLISIPRYFVVESICSCSRNYMSICINCHHSNCVMVQITNPLVLSGRLFKYVCTWVVRATTFLRIWTDILQNRLSLKYVHICSKTISLKNMKY